MNKIDIIQQIFFFSFFKFYWESSRKKDICLKKFIKKIIKLAKRGKQSKIQSSARLYLTKLIYLYIYNYSKIFLKQPVNSF